MDCHNNSNNESRSEIESNSSSSAKHHHNPMMLLLCIIPIILFFVIKFLYPGYSAWTYLLFLICPLVHIVIIYGIFRTKKKS